MTTNPRTTVPATSRWSAWRWTIGPGWRVPVSWARRAATMTVASNSIALARWMMTTVGGRASFTVTAPRRTWTTRMTRARVAGPRMAGWERWRVQANAARA